MTLKPADSSVALERNVPVAFETQVLVVGGGPAGIAAAVHAARQGVSVLLAEQSGVLGGTGVLAMVPEIMNFDDGEHFLAGGFGREVHDALFGECHYTREWKNVRLEPLKRFYDEAVLSSGVRLLLYVRLTDVIKEADRLTYAVFSGQEGTFAVRAEQFIDCTGSAFLASLAGAEWDYGNEENVTMPATLASLWGGVDFDKKKDDHKEILRAINDGVFSQYDTALPGIKKNYPEVGVGGGNVGHAFKVDDRYSETLTKATVDARKRLAEYETYYRNYVEGCENAVLLASAPWLGIRESKRIRCVSTLSAEHFSDGYLPPDLIGRYSYPVDIHPMTPDEKGMQNFQASVSLRHERGQNYGIPYGCLIPRGFANLFTAGRCIGADRVMQASARVIPCCYITGQAAGIAAALCESEHCAAAELSYPLLREKLLRIGAYL